MRERNREGRFDHFAKAVERVVASPAFFLSCLSLVLVWGPSYVLIGNLDTWQLVINTATTIVTFLLVALLTNTQARYEERSDRRQDEILDLLGQIRDTNTAQAQAAKEPQG